MTFKPALRLTIDAHVHNEGGKDYIVLFDRQRIAPSPLVLPTSFAPVLSLFTGEHTLDEILTLSTEHGTGLTAEILDHLVSEVDRSLLLESETFRKEEERIKNEYLKGDFRPSSCSGAVYPSSPSELKLYLDTEVSKISEEEVSRKGFPLALVIPHIDYARGASVYARVSKYLSTFSEQPETVIMLGTSHYGGESRYQLTRLDYQIPLATFSNAKKITEKIAGLIGEEIAFKDEFLHAHEHSLELPLPFLWHGWRAFEKMPEFVPILVGSFHESFDLSGGPTDLSEVSRMIEALAEVYSPKTMFVCSVDFSHVGRGFGDTIEMTEETLQLVQDHDRMLLFALENKDAEGLNQIIRDCRDASRVCGYPSLYTLLKVFERLEQDPKAELLDYRMHTSEDKTVSVSFAGLSFLL